MPVWHEATKKLQDDGKVRMVGIIQEQHPDRCRLFMQWKQMDWPVMVDSLNILGVEVVPITLGIDEAGVIRKKLRDPAEVDEFLSLPLAEPDWREPSRLRSDLEWKDMTGALHGFNPRERGAGDVIVIMGGEERLDSAIDIYQAFLAREPNVDTVNFRLGVAYRMRYDSRFRQPGDFQRAVQHWQAALDGNPNNYIWRRRIQQYGPRLDKPYPFYDWIHAARAKIKARGDTPVSLTVEPGEAELAQPAREFATIAATDTPKEPDPRGRIHRDDGKIIQAEVTVVPPVVEPGGAVRVHATFRPDPKTDAHWNNEARDLVVWVNPPDGWSVSSPRLTFPNPPQPESKEPRRVEFELRPGDGASPGTVSIPAYALYYVCEDAGGKCLYRRQNLDVKVGVETSP